MQYDEADDTQKSASWNQACVRASGGLQVISIPAEADDTEKLHPSTGILCKTEKRTTIRNQPKYSCITGATQMDDIID